MFERHKIYGNKWSLIAEAFPGRTDNSVKNYFYATIRRCLRRMNKTLGLKNGTTKMKGVKPSTLSTIFALAEGKHIEGIEVELKKHGLSSLNFKTLAENIMDFSTYKPKLKS